MALNLTVNLDFVILKSNWTTSPENEKKNHHQNRTVSKKTLNSREPMTLPVNEEFQVIRVHGSENSYFKPSQHSIPFFSQKNPWSVLTSNEWTQQ